MHEASAPPHVPKDSNARTLGVSLAITFACSLVVSAATVGLRPRIQENQRVERERRLTEVLARAPAIAALIGDPKSVTLEAQVIELATGALVPGLDAATFDAEKTALDAERGRAIPAERDIARLQRQARHGVVYLVRRAGRVDAVVLPVHGRGYASVIHAYVAIAADGNTILGVGVGEHGETPGVGSEIEDPDWLKSWAGKRARDERGEVRLRVSDEEPAEADAAAFHLDAISGATRSSEGLGNGVRFWLGDEGYGPFLARLARGELR